MSDDALLASVMRKLLNGDEHGWVDYAPRDGRWPGRAWITIDVRNVELTDEEYAAVERAVEP